MFNPERPDKTESEIGQKAEKEISPPPEFICNAETALRDFLKLKPEEKVLFLEDKKTNKEVAAILKGAVRNLGSELGEIILTKKTTKQEIEDLLKDHKVIINIFEGRGFKAIEGLHDEGIQKFGNRLLALYDIDSDFFKEGGALTEKLEDLEYRLNKMEAILKNAVGFKITSVYGTDLEVGLRPFKDRRWYKDTGVIDRPGQWDNLPGGEIFTVPDERNVNGILVLPALDSFISKEQGVDEFIRLNMKNGRITSIQGGKSAEKLRKRLEKDALQEYKGKKDPLNVYQCAEISFGANSKARSVVADPEQPYNFPGVSTTETEKRLGTMHIAFGDTKLGEEGAEGFIEAGVHYDFVIPRHGLTVEMFETEEDFKNKKSGRRIISNGGLNFF